MTAPLTPTNRRQIAMPNLDTLGPYLPFLGGLHHSYPNLGREALAGLIKFRAGGLPRLEKAWGWTSLTASAETS